MTPRSLAPLLSLLVLASACARTSGDALPDLRLPTLSATVGASLASCPTVKCLTVYVAPWCGYCRAGTPLIKALKEFLRQRGVETRIIVGQDSVEEVRSYAEVFGPDTLLDPDASLPVRDVPHFFVSDGGGRILREVAGMPFQVASVPELAAYYDLP